MAGKTCDICGKPSGIYPLCSDCFLLRDEGKVIKDEETGKWILVEEEIKLPTEGYNKCIVCGKNTKGYAFCKQCYNKHSLEELNQILINFNTEQKSLNEPITIENKAKQQNDSPINKKVIIDKEHKNRCITCGRETDGLLFCPSCYKKYHNKELLFKITNCSNVELLDESYEGIYISKDGHVVKSKSEREIDNYLFEKNIPHAYEKELRYGNQEKEVIKPDFYLPNYLGENKHVYIEHWGYNENNIDYTKTKKFKISIYKEKGITIISTHENKDMKDIESTLDWKLNKANIKENKINFDE